MFMDVSGAITANPPRTYTGVAVTDLDHDGRFEFVVTATDGPNRVLKWVGDLLREATPPRIALAERRSCAVAAADLDGDGREELYVVNEGDGVETGEGDCLFKANPDGQWEDLFSRTENLPLRNASSGRDVAVIDRRGVGRYGFLVSNEDHPIRLYEQGLGRGLTDLAPALGLALRCRGRGLLTMPVLSDLPDVIALNEFGPNYAFINQGDGTFRECAAALGLDDAEERSRCVVAVDANGDADLDLCWGNWDGPHRLVARNRDGLWRQEATAAFAFPTALNTVIAADFDNDGQDELFFHNYAEPNRLFQVRRTGRPPASAGFESEILSPPSAELAMAEPGEADDPTGNGTGAAICDIDGDGVLELLLARDSQPLALFKSRAASANNWLRIRPLTRFNAPARGAVVRVEALGRVSVRGVCGGSGYQCQMEPVAHFGLGPNGKAERVQVTWPDGASVILMNPRANRTITVPYPRG
jgi:hypothetical protein